MVAPTRCNDGKGNDQACGPCGLDVGAEDEDQGGDEKLATGHAENAADDPNSETNGDTCQPSHKLRR